jgi:hypothetical protein
MKLNQVCYSEQRPTIRSLVGNDTTSSNDNSHLVLISNAGETCYQSLLRGVRSRIAERSATLVSRAEDWEPSLKQTSSSWHSLQHNELVLILRAAFAVNNQA